MVLGQSGDQEVYNIDTTWSYWFKSLEQELNTQQTSFLNSP